MSAQTVTSTHIHSWGNSQGVRLSKNLLKRMNWSENEPVTVSYSKDQILIKRTQSLIEKLFVNYEDNGYKIREIDWGDDVGGEVF